MAKIIALSNQKGGVGKTTTTLNLGAALQEEGYNILLLDLDPQGSLTTSLGLEPEDIELTIYDLFIDAIEGDSKISLQDVVLETDADLDLIPANLTLASADMGFAHATMRELILREILENADLDAYHYVLIDCPPNLGILTINALSVADEVLIPLQAEYLALKGVNQLMRSILIIQRKINKKLKISGILLTMADFRTRHTKTIVESTKEALGGRIRVFTPVIKENVRIKDASLVGKTILSFASGSDVARAYRKLAKEVLDNE